MTAAYAPVKPSRSAYREVRGLRYGIREWGPADGSPLVLLHGNRDTSWTFQFLADALENHWRIVAPDWRGHGMTPTGPQGYWFHELLADLDGLLDSLFPHEAVPLVGHSLGGNVATVYAGLRPDRVLRVASLDAFGILEVRPEQYAQTLSTWLRPDGRPAQKSYESIDDMAQRLLASNARLTADKALFLAAHSSQPTSGGYCWQFPSGTRRSLPTLRTIDEWAACWRRIAAPALWIAASDPRAGTVAGSAEESAKAMSHLANRTVIRLAQTGHNMHHDAPVSLAAVLEEFLTGS